MLRKVQVRFPEELRAVDHGVHEDIVALPEVSHILPGKLPIHRQGALVLDHLVALLALLVIDIVAQQHVELRVGLGKAAQRIEDLAVGRCLQMVIAVDDLEEGAGRVLDARVDRRAVAAVLLVDDPDNVRIQHLILIRNFRRMVLRSVIDDDDLHVLAADQQRIDALFHVAF